MPVSPLEFGVVGSGVAKEVERFRKFLIERIGAHEPITFEEALKILPFGPMGGTTREDLIARGNISVISGSELRNDGEEFFGEFTDERLGEIAVHFPASISAQYQMGTETLSIMFREPIECVLYILPELMGGLRRSAYQHLHAVIAQPGYWTYQLTTQDNKAETLNIVIELNARNIEPSRYEYILPKVVSEKRRRCCCAVDKPTAHRDRRTQYGNTLPLHIRRLVEPSSHTIDDMVIAFNKVFSESKLAITVKVKSNETLNLPDLEEVDVIVDKCSGGVSSPLAQRVAQCQLLEVSDEQTKLYAQRSGVSENQVCIYVVKSINKKLSDGTSCSEDITGNAQIGRPSGMIEQDCGLYTLAHEVCHTLGLSGHNGKEGALMYPSMLDAPDKTPLLVDNEPGDVRSSHFLTFE